ncbi:MAG: hypothetical protein ACR2PL_19305 [Dehalococcoidia bacterium]
MMDLEYMVITQERYRQQVLLPAAEQRQALLEQVKLLQLEQGRLVRRRLPVGLLGVGLVRLGDRLMTLGLRLASDPTGAAKFNG